MDARILLYEYIEGICWLKFMVQCDVQDCIEFPLSTSISIDTSFHMIKIQSLKLLIKNFSETYANIHRVF